MRNNKLLIRKMELQAETVMLSKLLDGIDDKIAIFSTIDMIRVEQLVHTKTELEKALLDVLSESNALWLSSIVESNKNSVKSSKIA
jgi:hypothetical protein